MYMYFSKEHSKMENMSWWDHHWGDRSTTPMGQPASQSLHDPCETLHWMQIVFVLNGKDELTWIRWPTLHRADMPK